MVPAVELSIYTDTVGKLFLNVIRPIIIMLFLIIHTLHSMIIQSTNRFIFYDLSIKSCMFTHRFFFYVLFIQYDLEFVTFWCTTMYNYILR